MSEAYDVVIIGAGMVGAATALACRRAGLRVGVVEPRLPAEAAPDAEPDLRVSAISPASQRILEALGAWSGITRRRLAPYRRMFVWDAGGGGAIEFDADDIGVPCLGHIVENRVVQTALLERIHADAAIDVISPAAAAGFTVEPAGVSLDLEDGRVLRTRLLVGADGRESRVRAFAGIGTRGWAYDQQAIVATVATAGHHEDTAWQRFLPGGPLAFLPLWDGRSSIVWSAPADQTDMLMAMDRSSFARELALAIDGRFGEIIDVGRRAAFPLGLMTVDAYVAPRIALVGDAAHTIHPLAGQGVNLGLLDAAALAEVVGEAAGRGRDPGGLPGLRRYERWRKGHNLAMALAMDGFKRLFGVDWTPVRLVRSLGLNLTDRSSVLKRLLMRQAMGDQGDLPSLARR